MMECVASDMRFVSSIALYAQNDLSIGANGSGEVA